jgi:hypothetical protein
MPGYNSEGEKISVLLQKIQLNLLRKVDKLTNLENSQQVKMSHVEQMVDMIHKLGEIKPAGKYAT